MIGGSCGASKKPIFRDRFRANPLTHYIYNHISDSGHAWILSDNDASVFTPYLYWYVEVNTANTLSVYGSQTIVGLYLANIKTNKRKKAVVYGKTTMAWNNGVNALYTQKFVYRANNEPKAADQKVIGFGHSHVGACSGYWYSCVITEFNGTNLYLRSQSTSIVQSTTCDFSVTATEDDSNYITVKHTVNGSTQFNSTGWQAPAPAADETWVGLYTKLVWVWGVPKYLGFAVYDK